MNWANFFVTTLMAKTSEGHIQASQLRDKIKKHTGSEAYHCLYDLEPRADFKDYQGKIRPSLGYLWFDFDSSDEGLSALEDVKKFVKPLPHDILVCYSGSKGFHVGVPVDYLGIDEKDFSKKTFETLASNLKEKFPTLDSGIYNSNRKFRALGTRHQKTNRYKRKITTQQVHALSIEEIKTLSAQPCDKEIPVPEKRNALDFFRLNLKASPVALVKVESEEYFTQFEAFEKKYCITRLLEKRCPTGSRHDAALILATDFYHTGKHLKDAVSTINNWAVSNNLEPGRWENEIKPAIDDVYAGKLKYSFGCQEPLKAKNCSASCGIFKLVDPSKRPSPIDASRAAVQASNRSKKPKEFDMAMQLFTEFEGRLCRQDRNLFRYTGTHWEEMKIQDIDSIKQQIAIRENGQLTSRQVDGVYITFFRMLPTVPHGISLFDPFPFAANFKNGTLHIKRSSDYFYTTEFLPHRREDYLNTVLPFNYDPENKEKNTEFLAMLDRIFEQDPDKEDKILAVKQMYGACLIPAFPRFFFLFGPAGCGKSSLILLAKNLVSDKNWCSVEPHDFNGFNMESMVGKLVNLETDVDERKPISDSTIKKVIDRTKMRIKRKGIADSYGFLPSVHIFGGNKIPPTLAGESRAHERRWTFIEFKNLVTSKSQYNKEFHDWVFNQSPQGILNFALEGLNDLLSRRGHYVVPASGKEKMDEWRADSDSVALFIKNIDEGEVFTTEDQKSLCLTRVEGGRINRTKLYNIYKEWCENNSVAFQRGELLSSNKFYAALQGKGFREAKVRGDRCFYGFNLGVKKDAEF